MNTEIDAQDGVGTSVEGEWGHEAGGDQDVTK